MLPQGRKFNTYLMYEFNKWNDLHNVVQLRSDDKMLVLTTHIFSN